MRHLTLEIMLRVVFGARGEAEVAQLRDAVESTLEGVRSLPQVLAMVLVPRDLGPRSPWGRFRVAVERFDALLFELLARRRAEPVADSLLSVLLEQRDEDGNAPTDQHVRDQLVALLVGGHDSSAASLAWAFERLARHPAVHARLRDGDPAYLDAVVKEVLRVRPALTIAPRLLLEPVRIAGVTLPAGVQVAACLWLALRREDLWPQASAFRPETMARGSAPRLRLLDPVRWRRATLRRRPIRGNGDARSDTCCGGPADSHRRVPRPSVRAGACSSSCRTAAARSSSADPVD